MKKIALFLINILGFCIFFASFWAIDTYGKFSGDELFFHLLVPLGGINTQSFTNLAIQVFIPGVFFGVLISLLIIKFINKNVIVINSLLFLILLIFGLNNIHMFSYIKDQLNSSKYIENNYIETKNVEIKFPDKKRNLIYIFLESMENTYTDKESGGVKEKNLIPNLTKIANDNISFSNTEKLGGALPIHGTAWTAAAMVGQTSGLPLKMNTSSNGIINLNNFFPNTKSGKIEKKKRTTTKKKGFLSLSSLL